MSWLTTECENDFQGLPHQTKQQLCNAAGICDEFKQTAAKCARDLVHGKQVASLEEAGK